MIHEFNLFFETFKKNSFKKLTLHIYFIPTKEANTNNIHSTVHIMHVICNDVISYR